MNSLANFTINDPLDGQAVTIIVTLPASEELKDERQVLVSMGIANQIPVLKTGVFGNLTELIDEGWKAYGVQVEAAKVAAKAQEAAKADQKTETACPERVEVAVAPELIVEAEIEAEERDVAEAIEPTPVLPAPAPKPASNLSLF